MSTPSRYARFEGRFYPGEASGLQKLLSRLDRENPYPVPEIGPDSIYGAILPHAAHVYSGWQTLPFFQWLRNLGMYPETWVILHPNHRGTGAPVSLDSSRLWINCLGEVPIDRKLASLLPFPEDGSAFQEEHSGEVLLPFLQHHMGSRPFSILPVCMKDQSAGQAHNLAKTLLDARSGLHRDMMILASSDFSHFLSPEAGFRADQKVLDLIFSRDGLGLEAVIRAEGISVCGYGPILALMEYSRLKDENYQTRILARGHSGEVRPSPHVVDYISMALYS
ncbi:MAG: AmmeMemoRadiSam system protein B [Bacteroidales bacterium]